MRAKKILLIEDDIDIRENMAEVLEYEGYEVLEAEQGIEGIQQLEKHQNDLADVILLDLYMPMMNGKEFLDAVSAHSITKFKEIPVILITVSEKNVRDDLKICTAAVMKKPIDLKEFLNLLISVIGR